MKKEMFLLKINVYYIKKETQQNRMKKNLIGCYFK